MALRRSLVGERFHHLIVIRFAGSWPIRPGRTPNRHWECRCDCGGTIIATTQFLTDGRTRHCEACEPERDGRIYLDHYEAYREQFTPEQRQCYEQILRGRKGKLVESEAVDVVLRQLPVTLAVHEAVLGKGCVPASVLRKQAEAALREADAVDEAELEKEEEEDERWLEGGYGYATGAVLRLGRADLP